MANKRPDVMNLKVARRRFKLLYRWDFTCIICGHGFMNIACVTSEHLVPRSMGCKRKSLGNIAPTHHMCNRTRATMSLIDATKKLDERRAMMGTQEFKRWVNTPVPNRVVPPNVLITIAVQPCLEPPEYLPGLP